MSAEENKKRVQRVVDEAQSNGNLAVVEEIFADDFVDRTPFPGISPTREGVKTIFAGLRAGFPDLRVEIDEQIADEQKVVTRKTFRGTHRGEFMGVPASGRPVAFEVIDILTFRGDRIVEHRMIVDRLGLLQQLGAMA
jgi:steroid delta-isomerase-like uncharacterized protein